jgi:hypothetical protein
MVLTMEGCEHVMFLVLLMSQVLLPMPLWQQWKDHRCLVEDVVTHVEEEEEEEEESLQTPTRPSRPRQTRACEAPHPGRSILRGSSHFQAAAARTPLT